MLQVCEQVCTCKKKNEIKRNTPKLLYLILFSTHFFD
jgi:hypothetical protein